MYGSFEYVYITVSFSEMLLKEIACIRLNWVLQLYPVYASILNLGAEFFICVFQVHQSAFFLEPKTTCLIITPAHILECNTFVGKMRPAYRPLVKSLFRHDYIKQ